MNFNLLDIETAETNKTIKILIILIILVFIIIIGVFVMMILNAKGIKIQNIFNNKEEQVQAVSAETVEEASPIQEESIENEETSNLPQMNKETIGKIKDIYNQGDSEHKVAYLTFDDGPTKKVTPKILDILKEYDIKATFFVLGSNIKYNPDILKRAYDEGHYIANHSYSHEYEKIYDKKENVLDEYNKTEEAIREAIGVEEYSSGLFRFPGGSNGGKYDEVKQDAKKLLEKNNIAYLDWNALNSDAVSGTDKEEMIESVKETVEGNDCVVILMHDASDKQDTVDTLPEIIEYLRSEGYEFKNIYDIMEEDL